MKTPRMGVPDRLAERMSMAEQHDYLQSRRPSRRRVLQGGLAGAGALFAGPALFGGTASALAARPSGAAATGIRATPTLLRHAPTVDGSLVAPFGRHLAFGADPSRQVSVAWQVPVAVQQPFLRIGRDPWDLGHRIEAEVRPLHSDVPGAPGPVDQLYLHVRLDGLAPDTTYHYAVGHQGFDPGRHTLASTISSFTTAPRRGRRRARSFRFTAFGDQGVSYDALGNDSVILGQQPDFHLHAGDIAYADPSGAGLPVSATGANGTDQYDPRTWDQFLAQTEPIASSIPWMVATGNHDMEALYSPDGYGGQLARFDFPGNGPASCPSVYSFVYGNVAFISLDANDVSNEIPANRGYSGGSQTAWLGQELASLRSRSSDVDFIVVFFHHCAFSTTNQHASEGGVRADWVPLFDQYDVDLVVNGHNHIYERTDPLRAGSPTRVAPTGSTVHPADDGTTYITAGAAGRSLYSFPVADSYEGHESPVDSVPTYSWAPDGTKVTEVAAWSRVRYTGYSFIVVDAIPASPGGQATLKVRALAENATELDSVELVRTLRPHGRPEAPGRRPRGRSRVADARGASGNSG